MRDRLSPWVGGLLLGAVLFFPQPSAAQGAYTGDPRPLTHRRMYEWFHPLSDIVNALVQAGLRLDFLNEHEILTWRHYPGMIETGEDQFELGPGLPRIPLSFSIGARRPA